MQGLDFNDNLTLGGPAGIGSGKANLSAEVLAPLTEVAVSEQVKLINIDDSYIRPVCITSLHQPFPGRPGFGPHGDKLQGIIAVVAASS